MPAVSVWVMPAGILGVMSMPLGVDGFWWRVMGQGINWMIFVASPSVRPPPPSVGHPGGSNPGEVPVHVGHGRFSHIQSLASKLASLELAPPILRAVLVLCWSARHW